MASSFYAKIKFLVSEFKNDVDLALKQRYV